MLTRLVVRNFKRFQDIDIELGGRVLFIGPNNSGKTTAMQALALWNIGAKQWLSKRGGKVTSEKKRRGVTIGRQELLALPHPNTSLLWRDLHTRIVQRISGRQKTSNVRIDVTVYGVTDDSEWKCGLEFDYANSEFIYCRPLRDGNADSKLHMPVPEHVASLKVVYLPPMSGLTARETRLDPGAVNVRIGEGRTAEVLRNLCWTIANEENGNWADLAERIQHLFGVALVEPRYIPERGEIVMEYRERGSTLDISSSGRGLQQTTLILAYMIANPGATILLDEPDAHLEILRQRQIYNVINNIATKNGNQIIAASHSEIVLDEAVEKDIVIAFVGSPHRIADRGSQVRKALSNIGFDDYLQAEQTGWVLYLEGSTDLAILQAFARKLNHCRAIHALERPFVKYVGNLPSKAKQHFFGLREAVSQLKGVALFDRLEKEAVNDSDLVILEWKNREIESYLLKQVTLMNFALNEAIDMSPGPLFDQEVVDRRVSAMETAIESVERAMSLMRKGSIWSMDIKASDEVLDTIFGIYYDELGVPNEMRKRNFHMLADYVPDDDIDPEVRDKLDEIARTASAAETAPDDA